MALILAVFLAAISLTNPIGAFPLNDDWAWSKDVLNVLNGNWSYTGWEAMPLVPQIAWGVFVSKIFYFDYTLLRFSTLFLMLIEIFFVYKIVLSISNNTVAGIISLLLLLNPLNYALANTFMTDIPFLSILTPSLYFFMRYAKTREQKMLWISVFLCACAALLRQLAVIFAISYALSMAFQEGLSRKTIGKILIVGLGPFLTLFFYEFLLMATDKTPYTYLMKNMELREILDHGAIELFLRIGKHVFLIIAYCGFFFLPILFLKSFTGVKIYKKRSFYIIMIALPVAYAFLARNTPIPFFGNILNMEGIGPFLLKDMYILDANSYPKISNSIIRIATCLSILGGAGFLSILWSRVIDMFRKKSLGNRDHLFIMACVAFILYACIVSIFKMFCDRYVIIVFILVPLLIINPEKMNIRLFDAALSLAFVALIGAFSVASTHDYLNWNRSRWEAIGYLENTLHVRPEQMDGGFEYNAMHFFKPLSISRPGQSWWWVLDDEYLVAFSPVPGYKTLRAFPYARFLFGDTGYMYALQKVS